MKLQKIWNRIFYNDNNCNREKLNVIWTSALIYWIELFLCKSLCIYLINQIKYRILGSLGSKSKDTTAKVHKLIFLISFFVNENLVQFQNTSAAYEKIVEPLTNWIDQTSNGVSCPNVWNTGQAKNHWFFSAFYV